MPPAPIASCDPQRLEALNACAILDTGPEKDFDDLTALAARLLDAPIALVSLVDAQRQWFKSRVGLDATETPRSQAFCGYTILSEAPLVITNAATDPRTADNPLVTGDPGIRFYAGIPLRLSTGEALGSLCVIDTQPREITDPQLEDLCALANQAARQLELRRNIARLEQLNAEEHHRVATRTAFLAYMSHEIRTPLTAILGYADLITADEQLRTNPHSVHEAAGTIRRNASHLLSVVNDILDISKIEAGRLILERADVSPGAIVAEVEQLLGPVAERQHTAIESRVLTPIPTSITTDPTRLRQVLLNVVGNAVKFTPSGRVGIDLSFNVETESLSIGVTDTGIGMTPDELQRVRDFAEFAQANTSTARRFGGTGLGLRISKALAHLLGGDLTIDSLPEQGTIVTITIAAPISDRAELGGVIEAPRAVGQHESTPTRQVLAGRRLLLAEDGEDNRRLIAHVLSAAGADVTTVEDGKQALETIEKHMQSFDAVVMDMQMPVLDGYEATRALRAAGFQRPILALTANAMSGDRERCLHAGCDEYLTKPVDKVELRLALARLIGKAERDAA